MPTHTLLSPLRAAALLCLVSLLGFGSAARAQSAEAVRASARIANALEPAALATAPSVRLKGHIPPWANAANDKGAVDGSLKLNNLHLILSRAPQVEAAFDQLLADQQNPSSPRYHQWLTPQQNAEQYGVAASDLSAVKTWLQGQGLSVDDVAAGGVFITFSGPASAVQTAFSTNLHYFTHSGMSLYAPTQEPAIPAAISSVVASVGGLDDLRLHTFNRHQLAPASVGDLSTAATSATQPASAQPSYTSTTSGNHYLAPADWNIIYDNAAVLSSGITGNNWRVLILDYGRVAAADITYFETYFNLSTAAQPNTILLAGSADPGYDGIDGWQAEGTLDVERVLSTAPGSPIDYFIAATSSYSNTFSQLQYNISTLNDSVVSMSFGSCESSSSNSIATQFDAYFKTGAAQGIGNYVSSGDVGAAGCDTNGSAAPATQHLAPNVVCASGYATCVGGTEFAEGAGTFWSSTNTAGSRASVLSYIPEGAWNDPSYVSSGVTKYEPAASGGGVSSIITKPSWQAGVGVPADGFRDTPDVAFTSSSAHDGYLIYVTSSLYVFGGTSAAAPSMAAVAALLNQKKGVQQGNLNPSLYSLAASTPLIFHDVTVASSGITNCSTATPSLCNNSTPAPSALMGGQAGYALTTGYDQVTGLGSIDIFKLLATVVPGPSFSVAPSGTVLTISSGASVGNTDAFNISSLNGFAGSVNVSCSLTLSSGSPAYPASCSVSPATVTLTSGATATSTVSITSTTPQAVVSTMAGMGWGIKSSLLLASCLCLVGFRRRRAFSTLAAFALLAIGLSSLSGCGDGGAPTSISSPVSSKKSSAGTYLLTVTGTSTIGTSSVSLTSSQVTVTIN